MIIILKELKIDQKNCVLKMNRLYQGKPQSYIELGGKQQQTKLCACSTHFSKSGGKFELEKPSQYIFIK